MNNGESKQANNRKRIGIILLLLAVLGLISAVVLASILSNMSQKKKRNYIPIGDDTSVSSDEGETDEGELEVVWSKRIFCVSYRNGKGEVTALSDNGKNIIAPGTSWNYGFTLHNTKDVTLKYTMHMEAIVEGLDKEYTLPVLSRVEGPNGWLTRGGEDYTPVMELNQVIENGVLSPDTIADYNLSWKWPFESGDDELDTMLGDMAVDHDITLTINIYIYARDEFDPEIEGGDPIPGTGDNFRIGFWIAAMIISLFAFVAVLANNRRRNFEQA